MIEPTRMILLFCTLMLLNACGEAPSDTGTQKTDAFEAQVAEYIRKFPYQDTFGYAMLYTGGDPAKLNTWAIGMEPVLVRAGEDVVVRTNNDTYYKMAFLLLEGGPVVLGSSAPGEGRFNSFQLMDDRKGDIVSYLETTYG